MPDLPSNPPSASPSTQTPKPLSFTDLYSRSSSPIPPPVEPLSPTLLPTNPSTSTTSTPSNNQSARTYTHLSQTPQTFIPQPPPEPIDFTSNPDAIALRAAISVLQFQRQNAIRDLQTLQGIKMRASQDPEGFVEAVKNGEIRSKGDGLFEPAGVAGPGEEDSDDSDDSEDKDMNVTGNGTTGNEQGNGATPNNGDESKKEPWPAFPAPQNVIQVPSINWAQYGVMGDSLDKLHADQVMRPSEGRPAVIKADGTIVPVEGGKRGSGVVARPVGIGEGVEKGKGRGGLIKK